jgi:hypothetical protein
MNRREAVIKMAALMGAVTFGPRLLAGNFGTTSPAPAGFTAAQLALLDEIADTILPPTAVPGAKAAGVGAFIAMMVQDCYEADAQAAVRTGLARLDADYAARHQGPFTTGRAADRTAFLTELDREQRAHGARLRKERLAAGLPENGGTPHYFRILKELTLLGYFTSEIGCNQALQYAEVPGRYEGDLPYRKGERAWAPSIK